MKSSARHSKLSDEEVIEQYKKSKDKQLIGILFDRYGAVVYGVCLKYLKSVPKAQDMTMQIFEKLMDKLIDKPVLNFRAWLHVVSRNECLMLLRKTGKIHKNELSETQELVHDESALEDKQKQEIELNKLESAIQKLKPEQKTCIELFYIKEHCYQEVAEITGYTMKQVKSYIQNGKRNLRILLEKEQEFASNVKRS